MKATSAWMKMMNRHDAERKERFGLRNRWPWLGETVRLYFGSTAVVRLGIPIPYRGYPGANGEPK